MGSKDKGKREKKKPAKKQPKAPPSTRETFISPTPKP